MKRLLIVIPIAAVILAACNSGDVPVTTVQSKPSEPKPNSFNGAIQGNPNMPAAAKNALLHQGGK